jgi:flagellar motor switch protein FliG
MSLPQDQAGQLLSKLEPKQVEAVGIEIAKLSSVGAEEQNSVIYEFVDIDPSSLGGGLGGLNVAKSLVEKALGSSAGGTLDNVRQQIEAVPFSFLRSIDAENLLTFIMDEHPQTIALILSHLQPSYGAQVISRLPAERQQDVVRRIALMGQTNPEIIQEVERGLEHRMSSLMHQSFQKAGGVDTVAEILNVTDRSTERALLESLGQDNPELVDEIRRRMFVFEDILKFSNKDIQSILKNVETTQWAMALKGASEELKQRILGNMSQRAAEMLREEIGYLGAVKLSAVEQVQQQVVDIVRKLEDMGEITRQGAEEDQLVN